MSAVVREAQAYGKYGSSRVREPISVLGRTGALQLVEANDAEWAEQTPTFLATDLPVSEGVGNRNGAVFAFWIGDRDPGSPAVTQAMMDFVSDHDVAVFALSGRCQRRYTQQ